MINDGVYTALVTPFDGEENVNIPVLREQIRFQIEEGIDGLLMLGTTGEAPTLTREEQDLILKTAIEEAKGQVPIIAGTGAYSTAITVNNTKRAEAIGADMALIVTPYYNRPTLEGIYRHFKEISQNTSLPIIVYNHQGRTGRNIDTITLKRIAELPNIIGVKDSSGDIEQMADVIDCIVRERPNFKIFSGDDVFTYPLVALGGHGVISVLANLVPSTILKMTHAGLQGDFSLARKLHYDLLPLLKGSALETNPLPIKEAMNYCGKNVGGHRLPLCDMLPHNKEILHQILDNMNLIPHEALVQI